MTMVVGTAEEMYGSPPLSQPAGQASGPAGSAEQAAGGVRTAPAPSAAGTLGQPLFWLIVLIAVAMGLIGFSVQVGK